MVVSIRFAAVAVAAGSGVSGVRLGSYSYGDNSYMLPAEQRQATRSGTAYGAPGHQVSAQQDMTGSVATATASSWSYYNPYNYYGSSAPAATLGLTAQNTTVAAASVATNSAPSLQIGEGEEQKGSAAWGSWGAEQEEEEEEEEEGEEGSESDEEEDDESEEAAGDTVVAQAASNGGSNITIINNVTGADGASDKKKKSKLQRLAKKAKAWVGYTAVLGCLAGALGVLECAGVTNITGRCGGCWHKIDKEKNKMTGGAAPRRGGSGPAAREAERVRLVEVQRLTRENDRLTEQLTAQGDCQLAEGNHPSYNAEVVDALKRQLDENHKELVALTRSATEEVKGEVRGVGMQVQRVGEDVKEVMQVQRKNQRAVLKEVHAGIEGIKAHAEGLHADLMGELRKEQEEFGLATESLNKVVEELTEMASASESRGERLEGRANDANAQTLSEMRDLGDKLHDEIRTWQTMYPEAAFPMAGGIADSNDSDLGDKLHDEIRARQTMYPEAAFPMAGGIADNNDAAASAPPKGDTAQWAESYAADVSLASYPDWLATTLGAEAVEDQRTKRDQDWLETERKIIATIASAEQQSAAWRAKIAQLEFENQNSHIANDAAAVRGEALPEKLLQDLINARTQVSKYAGAHARSIEALKNHTEGCPPVISPRRMTGDGSEMAQGTALRQRGGQGNADGVKAEAEEATGAASETSNGGSQRGHAPAGGKKKKYGSFLLGKIGRSLRQRLPSRQVKFAVPPPPDMPPYDPANLVDERV